MQKKKIDILNGPLLKNIIIFAFPLMISSMLQILFNAIDIVVVGRYAGDTSLAAVSSVGSLINLITNLFIGLSVGTNVVVAKNIGAQDEEATHKAVQTSITISLLAGALLTIVGYFNTRNFLVMMDSPADVIDLSEIYVKIYFLAMPAIMLYNFGSAILRAKGDTKRPLYILFLAGILNAGMNLIFVIVFKMDVAGVGWATSISQYVAAILVLYCLIKEEGSLQVNLRQLKIDVKQLIEICRIGLPAGLQSTVFAISNVAIQSTVNSFGKVVMAGNGAASNLEGFVYVAMQAFVQSCITFTSQNYGARNYHKITKIIFTNVACGAITGIITGAIFYHFGPSLLAIYNNNPEVIAAGMERMNYVCRTYFLCAIMDIMVGGLRGIGHATLPMIGTLFGACLLRLIWIKTVFVAYGTISSVYISYPVSWILTSTIHIIYYFVVKVQLNKKVKLGLI